LKSYSFKGGGAISAYTLLCFVLDSVKSTQYFLFDG
jgi:hypothetical protein